MLRDDRYYRSDEEVEETLRRFESCALPLSEFNHRPHLVVALLYLLRSDEREAREQMRLSIHRFLEHHRLDAGIYHETITVFWLKRVSSFVARAGASRPLAALANELIDECDDSRLVFRYYSRELIESGAAREAWTEPDLKPLDF